MNLKRKKPVKTENRSWKIVYLQKRSVVSIDLVAVHKSWFSYTRVYSPTRLSPIPPSSTHIFKRSHSLESILMRPNVWKDRLKMYLLKNIFSCTKKCYFYSWLYSQIESNELSQYARLYENQLSRPAIKSIETTRLAAN